MDRTESSQASNHMPAAVWSASGSKKSCLEKSGAPPFVFSGPESVEMWLWLLLALLLPALVSPT
jgi:hypothetical protein